MKSSTLSPLLKVLALKNVIIIIIIKGRKITKLPIFKLQNRIMFVNIFLLLKFFFTDPFHQNLSIQNTRNIFHATVLKKTLMVICWHTTPSTNEGIYLFLFCFYKHPHLHNLNMGMHLQMYSRFFNCSHCFSEKLHMPED